VPAVNVSVGGLLVAFYWRRHRLAVETDGLRFHGTRRAFERDRSRDAHPAAAGVNVLRFTWRQIVHEPDEVMPR
jgi:very-short-patch-repair endonuclease